MALDYILASAAIVAIGIFTYNHKEFFTAMANPKVAVNPVSIYSNNDFILEYSIRFINDNYGDSTANGTVTHSSLINIRPSKSSPSIFDFCDSKHPIDLKFMSIVDSLKSIPKKTTFDNFNSYFVRNSGINTAVIYSTGFKLMYNDNHDLISKTLIEYSEYIKYGGLKSSNSTEDYYDIDKFFKQLANIDEDSKDFYRFIIYKNSTEYTFRMSIAWYSNETAACPNRSAPERRAPYTCGTLTCWIFSGYLKQN